MSDSVGGCRLMTIQTFSGNMFQTKPGKRILIFRNLASVEHIVDIPALSHKRCSQGAVLTLATRTREGVGPEP